MFVSIYYRPSLFNAHTMILIVHIFMNLNKLFKPRCDIYGDWILFILAKLHAYKKNYENSQMPTGLLLWIWMTYSVCHEHVTIYFFALNVDDIRFL